MLTVIVPETASDCDRRAVEGAASLEDFSWIETVGSRTVREEVEGSCSWVAML